VEECGNLFVSNTDQKKGAGAESSSPERHLRGDSPQSFRACSGCAGDYEDPDRTAWTKERERDEDEEKEPGRKNEFPALDDENAGEEEQSCREGERRETSE
jgi:hypothetical protein